MCGEHYDVHNAVEVEDWEMEWPEVVRTSPPDDVLRQISRTVRDDYLRIYSRDTAT